MMMMIFGMGPGWMHGFWCGGFSIILMGSMLKLFFFLFCFLFLVFIVEFFLLLNSSFTAALGPWVVVVMVGRRALPICKMFPVTFE